MCICKPKRTSGGDSAVSRKPLVDKDTIPSSSVVVPNQAHRRLIKRDQDENNLTSATLGLSLRQLSDILDPFFETCAVVRKQRLRKRRRQRLCFMNQKPTTSTRNVACVGDAFISPVMGVDSLPAFVGAGQELGNDALRDFLAMETSTWQGFVQEMEQEKHETSRLRV